MPLPTTIIQFIQVGHSSHMSLWWLLCIGTIIFKIALVFYYTRTTLNIENLFGNVSSTQTFSNIKMTRLFLISSMTLDVMFTFMRFFQYHGIWEIGHNDKILQTITMMMYTLLFTEFVLLLQSYYDIKTQQYTDILQRSVRTEYENILFVLLVTEGIRLLVLSSFVMDYCEQSLPMFSDERFSGDNLQKILNSIFKNSSSSMDSSSSIGSSIGDTTTIDASIVPTPTAEVVPSAHNLFESSIKH